MDRILLLSALILFTAASVIFAAPTQQRCKYFFLNYIKILFWIYKSHISLMWNILMIPAHQEMECIWLTVCLDVSFLFSSLNEQLANVNLPIILMGWPTVGESNGGILLFVMGEGNDRFRRVCLTCGIAQQNGNNEALCCGLSVLCTKALSPFANALCAPCRRNFFWLILIKEKTDANNRTEMKKDLKKKEGGDDCGGWRPITDGWSSGWERDNKRIIPQCHCCIGFWWKGFLNMNG